MKADMKTGFIHKANSYGYLEVIKYINCKEVKVKFLGYEDILIFTAENIREGKVKNTMLLSVYSVGFIGVGKYKASKNKKLSMAYKCWSSMLTRSYCDSFHEKNQTYKECSVCEEWHNFQVFAGWYYKNYPNNGKKYDLDKDKYGNENKIYSPETCCFISHKENIRISLGKRYSFISEEKEVTIIYNLTSFCKKNKLDAPSMYAVHSGKRADYDGWTKNNQIVGE